MFKVFQEVSCYMSLIADNKAEGGLVQVGTVPLLWILNKGTAPKFYFFMQGLCHQIQSGPSSPLQGEKPLKKNQD